VKRIENYYITLLYNGTSTHSKNLQLKQLEDDIKGKIVEQVQKITKFSSPTGLDIAHYVATLIENLVLEKSFDKMKIALNVFMILFPNITQDELQLIENNIEYLLTLRVVKKIPILTKVLHFSYEIVVAVFKKKFSEN